MIRRVARTCVGAGLDPVIAVLGHEGNAVRAALAGLPVQCFGNERFREGLSTSLRVGLACLPPVVDAALAVLADMPLVTTEDIKSLCAAYAPARGKLVCVPVHQGRRGNPVLLGREVFAALSGLDGDRGAKSFIAAHPHLVAEVPAGPGVLCDLDTPEAYEAYCRDAGAFIAAAICQMRQTR